MEFVKKDNQTENATVHRMLFLYENEMPNTKHQIGYITVLLQFHDDLEIPNVNLPEYCILRFHTYADTIAYRFLQVYRVLEIHREHL